MMVERTKEENPILQVSLVRLFSQQYRSNPGGHIRYRALSLIHPEPLTTAAAGPGDHRPLDVKRIGAFDLFHPRAGVIPDANGTY
jgi:hypothetical protein